MIRTNGSQSLSTTAAACTLQTTGLPVRGEYLYCVCSAAFYLRVSGMTGALPAGSYTVAANTPHLLHSWPAQPAQDGNFDPSLYLFASTTGTPTLWYFSTDYKL